MTQITTKEKGWLWISNTDLYITGNPNDNDQAYEAWEKKFWARNEDVGDKMYDPNFWMGSTIPDWYGTWLFVTESSNELSGVHLLKGGTLEEMVAMLKAHNEAMEEEPTPAVEEEELPDWLKKEWAVVNERGNMVGRRLRENEAYALLASLQRQNKRGRIVRDETLGEVS